MLYAFCQEFNVPHRRCGKLLVAAGAAEIEKLVLIKAQGEANGVTVLRLAERSGSTRARTGARGRACAAFAFDRRHRQPCLHVGASRRRKTTRSNDRAGDAGHRRRGRSARADDRDRRREPVADCRKARSQCGRPLRAGRRTLDFRNAFRMVPPLHLAKGNYFSLATRSPFSRLISVPTEGGLGVHLTLDLAGRARFGPDVEWIKAIDYAVDPKRAESFYAATRLLAGLARRLVAARLFGHPAEDRQARRVRRRLSHPDEKTSRRRGPDQPVWDQVAGPDVEPGDRRMDYATDLKFLPFQTVLPKRLRTLHVRAPASWLPARCSAGEQL